MPNNELIIGVELLDYVLELSGVAAELMEAIASIEQAKALLESTDTYMGKARDPMVTFVTALGAHVSRLQSFYEKAAGYAQTTYDTMYQSDAAMAVWMLKYYDGEVIVE